MSRQTRTSPDAASLYVGDLDTSVTKHELHKIFGEIGDVKEIVIPIKSGYPLGYAYINYKRMEDAEKAANDLRHLKIRGKQCRVQMYNKDQIRAGYNIFVRGLHKSIDNERLEQLFSKFGSIKSVKVGRHLKTNESLGYGYVNFYDPRSAKMACEKTNGTIKAEPFRGITERIKSIAFTNIYFKNIPDTWTAQDILDFFIKNTSELDGEITSHSIKHNAIGTFGFINFATSEQARFACDKLNGVEIGKHKLYVGRAQKKEERLRIRNRESINKRQKERRDYRIFIKNIPYKLEKNDLAKLFGTFGELTTCFIKINGNGTSSGRAIVGYKSVESATNAIYEMNKAMVQGRMIHVQRAINQNNNNHQRQQRAKPYIYSNYTPINRHYYKPKMVNHEDLENSMLNQNDNEDEHEDEHKDEVGNESGDEAEENEVIIWLKDIVGLPEYGDVFLSEAVEDLQTVKALNKQDLREIGVNKLGHIKKFLNCIETL